MSHLECLLENIIFSFMKTLYNQDGSYNTPNTSSDSQYFVEKYTEVFEKDSNWKTFPVGKLSDETPVINVYYLPTKLACKISFTSGYCVEYSKLINYLYNLQPNSRKFTHLIHYWMEKNEGFALCKKEALNVMILFYLQICQFLPAVKKVQNFAVRPFLIGSRKTIK